MASELLTERWTPLIVRELLCGSTRFNELRRGVPMMSPSLLAKRLKTLERVGVVERRKTRSAVEYRLTEAGEELRPLILGMGEWGPRGARGHRAPDVAREQAGNHGARGNVRARHMDASLLMWDVRRN